MLSSISARVVTSPAFSSSLLKRLFPLSASCCIIQNRESFGLVNRKSKLQLFGITNNTSFYTTMASSGDQKFKPQQQERKPGKEHEMDPTPQALIEDYKPANKLQGKVALVTGGDSGIGRAVCYCYALEGATVAFTYVKSQEDEDANETLEKLKEMNKDGAEDPICIPADLGYEKNCKKVVDEVINAYGRIDLLVNNAAEQYERPTIEDITEDQLERVFRTNIFSYFLVTKYALKHMKRSTQHP